MLRCVGGKGGFWPRSRERGLLRPIVSGLCVVAAAFSATNKSLGLLERGGLLSAGAVGGRRRCGRLLKLLT